MEDQLGRTRAETLAAAWALHEGAPERGLDTFGDLSLGETGVAYHEAGDVLLGRVWINMARTENAPPERLALYRKMEKALNDPAIGGMYDRAGGSFMLDEDRGGFFLVRSFPVESTTSESLIAGMEAMKIVAARWTTQWFGEVALIMHGTRPAPARPIRHAD